MSRAGSTLALVACVCAVTGSCAARTAPAGAESPGSASPLPPGRPVPLEAAAQEAVSAPARDCELISASGEPVRLVGVTEPVDPAHAPIPSNESERLVFRQLYETLVRVDCDGRVRPALAGSWRMDGDGRTWILTLAEHASFADATPVTAADVVASWSLAGNGGELRTAARRLVQAVAVRDERSLAITLRDAPGDAPVALAHSDLAVAKAVTGSPWPVGTRSARIGAGGARSSLEGATVIPLVQVEARPAPDRLEAEPFVTFVVAPGRDGRDLLDDGADLVLTRNPVTVRYASTLPGYRLVPTAWRHTRVFATRGRLGATLTVEQRRTLAADAVRGEARGAEEPFWWRGLGGCDPTPPQPPPPSASTGRVVYDASDGAARDLAERLVALAGTPRTDAAAILEALWGEHASGAARATGLSGSALETARRLGNDAGYVLTVERTPLDPCAEWRRTVDTAGWLTPEALVPLVDTRLQAIVREGRGRVTADGDGGLLLTDTDGAR